MVIDTISNIKNKINNADRSKLHNQESFVNIAKYCIIFSTLYGIPYYYNFFAEKFFI
jgi:hypothetical protein